MVVMSQKCPVWIYSALGLTNTAEPKYETLKFLGIGMGGMLVALQALMAYKRAKAMEDTAIAQANAVLKTEEGQRQDRLKNAIEHLGHDSDSVRLGGAYELFHLAQDTEGLRRSVLDILCAHIRQTTGEGKYQEKHRWKPSEEVQSLLNLLFIQKHGVFLGHRANLQGSWLNGAELVRADLRWADLCQTHLQGASLDMAFLQEALLIESQMQGARLVKAQMYGTCLLRSHLQGVNLGRAWLYGADLFEAQLQGVNLASAQLQGAIIGGIQLQGAHLNNTQLCGVKCEEDDCDSFEQRMAQSIGRVSDLSWVTFAGDLTADDIDSFANALTDESAIELRRKLQSHVGQPESTELPKDSGAIVGSYTKEDAEEWIFEYNTSLFVDLEDYD